MKRSVKPRPSPALRAARARLRLVSARPTSAPPTAVKAEEISLSRDDALEDAAARIFSAALDHFVANVAFMQASGAPEGVHQMRVALRRLRAAIGLMRPALTGSALETARERAKTLAGVLGAARNWDVFGDMLNAGPREALGNDPSFYALLDAVELRRTQAYREAQEALTAPQTAQFVEELRLAIAQRDWRVEENMRGEGSARDFASRALTRLRKRLLKKSRDLATLSPEARHQARIALKKARYGAEFFHSLYADRKTARAFMRALSEMQDGMGAFNDMAVANSLLDQIDADGGGAATRASGFVRGWFAHAAREGAAHAEKSEKRLKELEPFWT